MERKHLGLLTVFSVLIIFFCVYAYTQSIPDPGQGGNEIFIRINGNDKDLQQAISDGDFETRDITGGSYSGSIFFGHKGEDVILNVGGYAKSLQESINDGSLVTAEAETSAPDSLVMLWNKEELTSSASENIAVDSEGNVIIVGTTLEGGESIQLFIKKYDSGGDVLMWEIIDFTGSEYGYAYDVAVDSQDNIIVAGKRNTGVNSKLIVKKYDPDGNEIWYNEVGSPSWANGVTVDSQDNVIAVGRDGRGPTIDFLTVKYSPEGALLWEKNFGINDGSGSFETDVAHAVATDSQDNVIVAGVGHCVVELNQDIVVIKYNPDGNLLWDTTWGEDEWDDYDTCRGVAVDEDDNIVVAGYSSSFTSTQDLAVVKFDPSLDLLWYATTGSTDQSDHGKDVVVMDGDVFVTGRKGTSWQDGPWNDMWVLRYDSSGDLLWEGTYGDLAYEGTGIDAHTGGYIYVTGLNDDKEAQTIKFRDWFTLLDNQTEYPHSGYNIWVSVDGDEKTLQDAVNDGDLFVPE